MRASPKGTPAFSVNCMPAAIWGGAMLQISINSRNSRIIPIPSG